MMRDVLFGFAIASLVVAGARAQAPVSDQAKAMAGGSWEFSNADRDKRCMIAFRTAPAAAGMKLDFDKACAEAFPFIKDIAGWSIAENDFLRLLDARGKRTIQWRLPCRARGTGRQIKRSAASPRPW